ncbi:MAG: DNA-3-methyladenine glycosylase [Candidatus Woesearchaeota archaeon]
MEYENPLYVAEELIGMYMEVHGQSYQITGAEAFEGGKQTPRRECMLKAPGVLAPMPFRGMHFLNVGTEAAGKPSCVMIRSVRTEEKTFDGPGKVGKELNAVDLEGLVLGSDVRLNGTTQPSDYINGHEFSGNILGRYNIKD